MRALGLGSTAALVLLLAACGGGGGSSNGSTTVATSLVTQVKDAKAEVHGNLVTASAVVTYGGKPGRQFVLRYGLVDAVSGVRASQGEKVLAHLTTGPDVVTKTFSATFNPQTPTDYIVHFALSTPQGVYVASDDTDVFTYK